MNDDLTDITIVLDRSGSMSAVRADTIGGFNTFLADQKAEPEAANFSLFQFDTQYETVHSVRPLQDVPELTMRTFVPRGGTALLDAIGRTINETGARLDTMPEAKKPGKVLLVIMTDGEENSSCEFTRPQIFDMITHQRDVYDWQIAFIGANQDAIAVAGSMGIPASNSLNFVHTGEGTQTAMRTMSEATNKYRKGAKGQKANYFIPEDEEAKDA